MHRVNQWVALAVMMGIAGPTTAATLTGDTIRMVAINESRVLLDTMILVEDGPDLLGGGNTVFDFDTGSAGNEFELFMEPLGEYGGVFSTFGTTEITLSGLDFSGDERLFDWAFLQVPPEIPMTADLLSPSSIKFSWTESRFVGGTFFRGRFLTRGEEPGPIPSPIPLPAGGLLLMSAVGLAVGLGRRHRTSRSAH